ncbi:RNA-binding protein 39-like protein Caper [Dermatophagoides farinae]|uniref:Rna-binding protein 39-like protein n=1 Tax=Dermatophagoides farinae TaxID=6954 RepID=A0A9D4SCL0_DERFA|nr:RNA-binding protein 39-like [Dermatophagoides farinae]KAH7637252.1 rna-binding protein 39-like protein [Dermatophagoides farinae]
MAEDFDVEALLEAAVDGERDFSYNNNNHHHGSKGDGHNSRDADRSSKNNGYSKDVDEKRSKHERTKSRSEHHRSHERRRRSNSRERSRRSRSKDRKRSRRSNSRSSSKHHSRSSRHRSSRSRSRDRKRSPDRYSSRDRHHRRSPSPPKELPLEERDQRTVFCMQLAARVRHNDIEEFFSNAGKVREVRLIMDNRTRRHKGIAYVEFVDIDSVGRAIALTGTRLCGVPIVVQHSQAEKNRLASMNASQAKQHQRIQQPITGPMSLYVGSLHFNITEEMLRGIFEPFGKVEKIELSRDTETNRSKGYGFVHFKDADDAKKAIEQLNGFELAGRPMKVNYVTERSTSDNHHSHHHHHHGALDCDELDRTGIDLGATGRLQLMAKLAEGTGIEFPKAAMTALQMSGQSVTNGSVNSNSGQQNNNVPIATQCFLLSNMFDPRTETNPNWPEEIKNDVIEECRKHGGIIHIYVDPTSNDGHVYVKCASISSATASVNSLHGRWFAGRLITAAFVPVIHYHNLFPESANTTTHL